jgi:FkbM family methyltransferase
MQPILTRQITRRNPFRIKKVPWIARVYAYPFERWSSLGTQAVFGAPNFILYLIFQRFSPFKHRGQFGYIVDGKEKDISFNALNTQFSALYLKMFAGGYEPHISALLNLLLPKDGVFYDIGSNWGWFSLHLASAPDFRGKIHAFEPFPPSYQDVSSIVRQAGMEDRVTIHNLALSDHEGTASMHLPTFFQSGAAVMQEDNDKQGGRTTMSSLDSLKLEPPSLMKVDVEGSEAKVFRGGRKMLSTHKPMLVFENSKQAQDPWQTLEPLTILHEIGYEFYQVGWLRSTNGKNFIVGDDDDPGPQAQEKLSLTKFEWPDRFLRHPGINIFACHRDCFSKLKAVFQDYTLES